MLIAYEGGICLWNIGEKREIRNWEISLPPGAVGGGNDEEEQLFSERRLPVTCLAWRPDGLLFAAGHEDGCISFISLSDDFPITIRTIERVDVHKTTEEDLFGWSSQGNPGERKVSGRESVFKLSWSSFPGEESYLEMIAKSGYFGGAGGSNTNSNGRPTSGIQRNERTYLNGGTVLTIMGGILPNDPTGIHLLEFPPYVPPSTGQTSSHPSSISAPLRQSLKDSITPISHNFYSTSTPPEDFYLLPRDSPYYSLSFDPTSIIITTGQDRSLPSLVKNNANRSIEAFTFPITTKINSKRMKLPERLNWNGNCSCVGIEIFNIPRSVYTRLNHEFFKQDQQRTSERIPLKGGKAYMKMRKTLEGKKARGESNEARILVSMHLDLKIRFWDVSDHLLLKAGELVDEYPKALSHLTFDVKEVLRKIQAESNGGSLLQANRILNERSWELELIKVDWAIESMELAIELSTGDIITTRFGYGIEHYDPSSRNYDDDEFNSRNYRINPNSIPSLDSQDIQDRCIDLSHLSNSRPHLDSFQPSAAFSLPPLLSSESKSCLALSDIGFLAASSGNTLLIADLRGPDVLLYESARLNSSVNSNSRSKGKGKVDQSIITNLNWTISAIGEGEFIFVSLTLYTIPLTFYFILSDHDRNPRLIVVQASGLTRVYELAQIGSNWHLNSNPVTFHHNSLTNTFKTFVIDRVGSQLTATPQNLQLAVAHQNNYSRSEDARGSFSSVFLAISNNTITCHFNISGSRTALYEDNNIGFEKAELVTRQGCLVLVVVSRNRSVSIFSVPDLVPIHKMAIPSALQ